MMFLLWTMLILVVLFLIGCAWFLALHAAEVRRREDLLHEAFWKRRNKIPLLLEMLANSPKENHIRNQIITLRNKVSSCISTLEEIALMEAQLSILIDQLMRTAFNAEELGHSTQLISLKQDFARSVEAIRISCNDYNYSIEEWMRYIRWPWFNILGYAFETRHKKPLPLFK